MIPTPRSLVRRRTPRRRRRPEGVFGPVVLSSALSIAYVRLGDVTRVTATSSLADAYFVWYLDGAYVATTRSGVRDFVLQGDDQARVEVLATTDPAFDPIANAPAGYPPRRSIWWVRSTDSDVDHYLVEESVDGGSYSTAALVPQTPEAWSLSWLSGRLDDLSTYAWRVTPVDAAGNAGTATVFGPELVVRRPDAPDFTASVAAGLVTVSSA